MKIILGIDPGSIITGYGILKYHNNNIIYIYSGYINLKEKNFFEKLKRIYNEITFLVRKFKPNCSAVEQIFIGKNFNSSLKLSQARSAALLALINLNIPIFEYNVTQIKKHILKNGSGNKINLQYTVKDILKLYINLKQDVIDALAIAITHCYILNNNEIESN